MACLAEHQEERKREQGKENNINRKGNHPDPTASAELVFLFFCDSFLFLFIPSLHIGVVNIIEQLIYDSHCNKPFSCIITSNPPNSPE